MASDNSEELLLSIQHVSIQTNWKPSCRACRQHPPSLAFRLLGSFKSPRPTSSNVVSSLSLPQVWDKIAYGGTDVVVNSSIQKVSALSKRVVPVRLSIQLWQSVKGRLYIGGHRGHRGRSSAIKIALSPNQAGRVLYEGKATTCNYLCYQDCEVCQEFANAPPPLPALPGSRQSREPG